MDEVNLAPLIVLGVGVPTPTCHRCFEITFLAFRTVELSVDAAMLKELLSELYGKKPAPDKPLYHYTSLEGLRGIVRSKTLWATDIRYLNDVQELVHFGQLIKTEIRKRLEREKAPIEILRQFQKWLSGRLSGGPMLFIGSFTEKGNLLSQWRGYCPHGKGVSIGFLPDPLIAAGRGASFDIGKCVYKNDEQEAAAAQVVQAAIDQAGNSGPDAKRHASETFWPVFFNMTADLLRIAALMKNAAFSEEVEWRLVSPPFASYVEPSIEYREGIATLVPYMELPLPVSEDGNSQALGPCHLFIGPTPHPELSINALQKYLSKEGVKAVRISSGGIPYRPM